jgi:hypothetical protein
MRKVLGVGFKRIGDIIKKGEEREREKDKRRESKVEKLGKGQGT